MTSKKSFRWGGIVTCAVLIAMVACSKRENRSQITGPLEGTTTPSVLSKPAGKTTTGVPVVIFARVVKSDTPFEGVAVSLSRSIAGLPESYLWTGITDADGQVDISVETAGYYRAKVTDPMSGDILGQWGSIPINSGKAQVMELSIGEQAITHSGGFTAIYAFGDSYVDNGDFFTAAGGTFPPDPPYWAGRWTNGENFVDIIAQNLGLEMPMPSVLGGTNYGFGGAMVAIDWDYDGILVRSTKTQVEDLVSRLGAESADAHALYVFYAGGGDIGAALEEGLDGNTGADFVTGAANDLITQINTLASKGARNFLVLDQYNMGLAPIPGMHGNQAATDLCKVFNHALISGLADLEHLDIVHFDFEKFVENTLDDFTYADVLYLNEESPDDSRNYLFLDDFGHFTARPNRKLGNACTAAVLTNMTSK